MSSQGQDEFKVTITQDKLVDILLHAATREDIAKLDTRIDRLDTRIDRLETKIDNLESMEFAKWTDPPPPWANFLSRTNDSSASLCKYPGKDISTETLAAV